jgi:hypothetical protein
MVSGAGAMPPVVTSCFNCIVGDCVEVPMAGMAGGKWLLNASSRAETRPLAIYRGRRQETRSGPGNASKRLRTEKTESNDCASEESCWI